jgi:protein-S-isoprenylcysteine O-methyltransferase Ste14
MERWVPLVFWVAFVAGLVGYRAARFRRRYGIDLIRRPASSDLSAHAFLSRALIAFFGVMLVLSLLAALSPGWLEVIDPLYARRPVELLAAGAALGALAWVLVWRAQDDMAASWRIGIDKSEKTELVTGGLYRFCRHPIYLGLQLGLLGFTLLIPGYLTAMLMTMAAVLFQVQARLEEEFQHARHGETYARYCAEVGRFFPWTGRWPRS